MVNLIIDPITKQITGYEYIDEKKFSTDITVDEKELDKDFRLKLLNGTLAYENGRIVEKESCNEYHKKINNVSSQIQMLMAKTADETKVLINYMLEGKTQQEAIEAIGLARTQLTEKLAEKKHLEDEHADEVRNFYAAVNIENDKKVNHTYFSSIVLLCRDETPYLDEWIAHHIEMVDHIFIYDHKSIVPVRTHIDKLSEVQKAKVTVIEWNCMYDNCQEECYNHFLDNFKTSCKWTLFIDADEFLIMQGTTVNEFLATKDNYTVVYGPLQEFNANGKEFYEDKPVMERFTQKTDVFDNLYHKDFVQVNRIDKMIRHYPYYDTAKHLLLKSENNNKELFCINHYYTKSFEEWCLKIKRGSCDPKYLRKLNEFFIYNPDMTRLKTDQNIIQDYKG